MKNDKFSSDRASDLIIQPNGTILVAGVSDDQYIVSRVSGNPSLQGLDNALAFSWQKAAKNKKQQLLWEASDLFHINAWIEGALVSLC